MNLAKIGISGIGPVLYLITNPSLRQRVFRLAGCRRILLALVGRRAAATAVGSYPLSSIAG